MVLQMTLTFLAAFGTPAGMALAITLLQLPWVKTQQRSG